MKTPTPLKNYLILALSLLLFSCREQAAQNKSSTAEKTVPKLFLLSKGLENDTLKTAFLKFIEKAPATQKVAVVVNASSSEEKKIKKTRKVKTRFASIGFDSTKVELFDVMKRNPQGLADFDIIYILGGNPFLLFDEVKKSKADVVLKELAGQDKILMGYSAGTLLLGPGLELMNQVDALLEFNQIGLKELSGIGLYDFLVFPHYDNFTGQVEGLAEEISRFESKSNYRIIKLNDNQGIIYEEGAWRIIGG